MISIELIIQCDTLNDKQTSTKVKEIKEGTHQAEAVNIYPDYKQKFLMFMLSRHVSMPIIQSTVKAIQTDVLSRLKPIR